MWDTNFSKGHTVPCNIELYETERWQGSHTLAQFLAATKQLYKWYFPSVCPSVRLSHLFDYVPIIVSFSGVITLDQGKVHAKGQGQRSKVKVTEVTTQLFVSGL